MTKEEIDKLFDTYLKNEKLKKELEDDILSTTDKELWISKLKERAVIQRMMYLENNQVYDSLKSFLDANPNSNFTPTEAQAIFDGFHKIYNIKYHDDILSLMLIDPLMNYYKRYNGYNKLIILHLAKYLADVQEFRLSGKGEQIDFINELNEALSYKIYYKTLSPEAREKIFIVYHNLVTSVLEKDLDMSYYYLTEMLSFGNSDIVNKLSGDDTVINSVLSRVERIWYNTIQYTDENSQAISFFKKRVYELSKDLIDQNEDFVSDNYRLCRAYVIAKLLDKTITKEDALTYLCEYYKKMYKYFEARSDSDSIMFPIYFQQYIHDLFVNLKLDDSLLKPYVNIFYNDITCNWARIYHAAPAEYLDKFVSSVFFTLLRFFTKTTQETLIRRLIYQHHLTTFIHVNMVSQLAQAITKSLLDNKKEVFVGLFGLKLNEIDSNRERILTYVKNAAFYHDIGKLRIGDIISRQTIKLSEDDFKIIITHPTRGAEMADKLDILKEYKDVIIGHHKSYDGKTGYPLEFDNTKSNVRIVIDIITICDSLDAATDKFGRNYTIGKNTFEVIDEIVAAKGIRYNPDIADLLNTNTKLRNEIKKISVDGRTDKLYEIFNEYQSFTKK